jgi:Ca-activated chloride channel family protein
MIRAALVAAVLCTAGIGSSQQVFRAGVDLVHFGVVVTDRQGAPIAGLTVEDFEVVEEGTPQSIRFFAAGDPAAAPPLHLGFLLDMSGSMEADARDVRTAAIKFLNAVTTAVDVTLVDFDTEVRVARYDANDFPRLIERIRMRKPEGWTAFYDALATYLHGAAGQSGQKIAVVYTDGGDTRSTTTQSDLLNLLKASDVTLYTIGYLEQHLSTTKAEQRRQLSRIAELTGGQGFFPTSPKEVDKMYEQIQREIAARYSLGYLSSDTRTDGAWREVEIRLKRKDLKGAKIRTRGGYFAPYKPSQE